MDWAGTINYSACQISYTTYKLHLFIEGCTVFLKNWLINAKLNYYSRPGVVKWQTVVFGFTANSVKVFQWPQPGRADKLMKKMPVIQKLQDKYMI